MEPEEVLEFWMKEVGPKKWFVKDKDLDNTIKEKFLQTYNDAVSGELEYWKTSSTGCLALIIVLDQFPRNMFRNNKKSFATDNLAVELAEHALEEGFDNEIEEGKSFFYLPLMHSEEILHQKLCYDIFSELAIEDEKYELNKDFAKKHLDIIEKFGRFPHRNKVLGRESTKEELEFLKTHKGF